MNVLSFFRWDLLITAAAIGVAFWYGGWGALSLVLILIVVEFVFSFDNAAVNAKYVGRLNPFWQKIFLTIGVLIAVFGMRLVFPFVVVWLSAGLGPAEAVSLALEQGDPHTPGSYGYILHEAHPVIAAFGGMFLLMLFLDFFMDTDREVLWLSWVERPLKRLGQLPSLPVLLGLVLLLLISQVLADDDVSAAVLVAGVIGMVTYLAIHGFAQFMESREGRLAGAGETVALAGRAAFSVFLFLEVLDASFSFDGVIGAFAITSDPLLIALGLGVGAMYVRSLTIYLVRTGALHEYKFLEQGAHWAIGALATLLLITVRWEIPEIIIGLTGISFIVAALVTSRRARVTP